MLTRKAFLILLVTLVLGCVNSTEKKTDRQIDAILNLSETRQVTQMFPGLVRNELLSMQGVLDSADFRQIMDEAVRYYSADSLWKYTRRGFSLKDREDHAEDPP
jgi:hypothetical protein